MSGMPRWWILRIAAGLALAAAIAAVAIFTLRNPDSTAGAVRPVHRAIAVARAAPLKAKAISAPSAFDKEQQMRFSQLMGRWNPMIAEASKRFGVPETWIRAVMRAESGGRTMLAENQPITSSMGAMGLMQLMPSTYNDMRVQYGLGPDPYDPHDNILAGAAYLRWLRGKYGYPEMFAAYNDGPGNLEDRLLRGGLLPAETRLYLTNIAKSVNGKGGGLTKFTRPNGMPVWIDGAAVVSVRAALPDEYAPGVQSVITVGMVRQGVRESVAAAKHVIRAHGGAV